MYLNKRWTDLRYHAEQQRLWNSDKRFCVVPAGRRSGKCLAKDSRVFLSNGTVKNVQDVIEGDMVWSLDKKYKLEQKKVSHIHSNGIKKCIKVSTNKRSTICTPNHPFIVNNEWVEAGDIKISDLISVIKEFKSINDCDDFEIDYEDYDGIDLDMLSFWIAEGSKTKIATKDDCMLEIVQDFCEEYDLELRKSVNDDCSYNLKCNEMSGGLEVTHPLRLFLEQYGLFNKTSKTKFIPEFIYSLSKEQLSRFLSVFVGCDGCVNKKHYSQQFMSIGLANEFMITQLSELFHRFGIIGRRRYKLHSKKSKITGYNFESWEFKVSEKNSFLKFYHDIGALGKEHQLHQCYLNAKDSLGTCNDYIPISYDEFVINMDYEKYERDINPANRKIGGNNAMFPEAPPELLKLLTKWRKRNKNRLSTRAFEQIREFSGNAFDNLVDNDMCFEEVKSIEDVGFHQTYDLTVEDNHNFIVGGLVTHNTELAKRKLVTKAIRGTSFARSNFFAAAPTRDQAKRIFWEDLKALVPRQLIKGRPKESDLIIEMIHGPSIHVIGLDVAERIEGSPWDGGILDEYGNMKKKVWGENVRPALSDRGGWCWLIGVPEGRNHYYRTYRDAKSDTTGEWGAFHWFSADILPAKEIESARDKLDTLTFQQEYEGSFLNFQGRIYHPYDEKVHSARLKYFPYEDLILVFDFNVSPGVCAIIQEQMLEYYIDGQFRTNRGSGIIGEIYIERDSNTERVCRELLSEWGDHKGKVTCYGDSTGGSKGTAKVKGSDWEIIKAHLSKAFGTRLSFKYPKKNPPERTRINSVNSRLRSSTDVVRMMVDPVMARHVGDDFDGVQVLEGSSGEIDKKSNPELTHISDAIGYYVNREFPVVSNTMEKKGVLGV